MQQLTLLEIDLIFSCVKRNNLPRRTAGTPQSLPHRLITET